MTDLKKLFSGWPRAIIFGLPIAAVIVALLLLALRLGLLRENVYYLAPPLAEVIHGRLLMLASTWLVAAICLYCGCTELYLAFLVPELAVAVLCKMTVGVYEYVCSLFFPLVFTITALLAFHRRGWGRFVFAALTLLGAIQYGAYIAYVARFGGRPSATAVIAALSTHAQEAAAFLSDQLGWGWVALGAGIALLIFVAARCLAGRIFPKRSSGWLYFCLLAALAMAVGNARKPDFYGNFFIDIRNGLRQYRLARKNLAIRRENLDDNIRALRPTRHDKGGELLLVVIGESANRQQHGCFGYDKDTTPWLSSAGEPLILFNNAFACMTHTEQAVTLALNLLNDYSPAIGPRTNILAETMKSPSVLDILHAVGTRTYWFSAQNKLGAWDSFITSQLAMSADEMRFLCDEPTLANGLSHHIDGELIDWVRETVNKADPAKHHVIFLHLIGSHWPTMLDTPPDWPFVAGNYKDKGLSPLLKAYDRTVSYTDWVLSQFADAAERSPFSSAGMIYFSDHSEGLPGGHNFDALTPRMMMIPAVFWCSKGYAERWPETVAALRANRHKVFTNDLAFDLICGVNHITFDGLDETLQLTSPHYRITPKTARFWQGRPLKKVVPNLRER